MTSSRERRKYAAQRKANPVQRNAEVAMVVTYHHPAGPVQGTITQVAKGYVLVQFHRAGGLEPLILKFTLRPDGEYRLRGASNSARPALTFPKEG